MAKAKIMENGDENKNMNRMMILKGGSPAIHKAGDIGRKEDSLIRVRAEADTYYIGEFYEGYGFINVKFRKEDCRTLTQEEIDQLNGGWYGINDIPLHMYCLDGEGNITNPPIVKGVINKITTLDGQEKHHDRTGLDVRFYEKIVVGKSLIMLTDRGYMTTSMVTKVERDLDDIAINTLNSIYHISLLKGN